MFNKDPRQMSYWQDAEGALWEALSELLVVTLMDGVGEGVKTLPANIQVLADFNWVNQSVLNFARDYRYDWIKKITETTRTQVQQAITDWMREGAPLPALEARLTPIFGAVRAEMIAATETTRVFAEGNRLAWESAGVVSKVIWQTAEDDLVCPICGPLNNTEIGIGDIDAMPPAHVNCRCFTHPVVDLELVKQKFEKIFS